MLFLEVVDVKLNPMKTSYKLKFLAIISLLYIGMTINGYTQEATDVAHMLNGETKSGKVTGITDDVVKFKYTGEDLEYEIKKPEIQKIIFSSGRTEVITDATQIAAAATPASSAADRKTKIAVLPFDYVTNDPSNMVDAMKTQIQAYCAGSFSKQAPILAVQDPMTTNSLLAKNNITSESIKATAPMDLAVMLGVEYVVYGSFNVLDKGATISGTTVTSYKDKEQKNKNNSDTKSDAHSKGTAMSSGSSNTYIHYETHVDVTIYDDQGKNIYSESRRPFFGDPEGYKGSIDNHVRHSPFGSKHK